MIPLNIDDNTVLRRVLEDIESRLPVDTPMLSNINRINDDPSTTIEDLVIKINEIIRVLNTVTTHINSNNSTEIS